MNDRYFIKLTNKYCYEIEADFTIIKDSKWFLDDETVCYREKGQNTICYAPIADLLKNPKVSLAVGTSFYRVEVTT